MAEPKLAARVARPVPTSSPEGCTNSGDHGWKKAERSQSREENGLGGALRTAHASHRESCHGQLYIFHEVQIFLLVSQSTQVYQAPKSSSKSMLCVFL